MEDFQLYCEKCGSALLPDEINVKDDLAKCHECGYVQKASKMIELRDFRDLELLPPEGSDIEAIRYSDSILEINVPRKGFKDASRLSPLGFGCFWLGFVAFWTFSAAAIGGFFALFSIPFWIVGIGMVYGFTKTALEKQKIELTGKTLKITKTRLLNSKETVLDLMDIDAIDMKGLPVDQQVTKMLFYDKKGKKIKQDVGVTVPTIKAGDKKETILDYGSNAEKIWVSQLIKEFVLQSIQKKV